MRSGLALAAAFSALMLTACETPRHSNTLIFGTNTKVALDVSADQIKQTPSITLGYTRQEAVWMPLMPNVADKENDLIPCKELVTDGSMKPAVTKKNVACSKFGGTQGANEEDTYSVLASFGADFSGGANTDASGAATTGSAGIAQYFATGIAARTLANAGSRLVSVQPTDEKLFEGLKAAQMARLGISDDELKRYEKERNSLIAQFLEKCAPSGQMNTVICDSMLDKALKSDANPSGVSDQSTQLVKIHTVSKNVDALKSELSHWTLPQIQMTLG